MVNLPCSAWVNRSRARARKKINEDDMATKIQAGYKGMMAREEFSDLINTRWSIRHKLYITL